MLRQVESKGDNNDKGKTPSKKPMYFSHKSLTKRKAGKTSTDFHTELKSMDDKWSECFAQLEAMFLVQGPMCETTKDTQVNAL